MSCRIGASLSLMTSGLGAFGLRYNFVGSLAIASSTFKTAAYARVVVQAQVRWNVSFMVQS